MFILMILDFFLKKKKSLVIEILLKFNFKK
jgi:hypothetical protein